MSEWTKSKEETIIDSMALQKIKDHLNRVVVNERRSRERARAQVGLKMIARYRKESEEEYYGRKP